MAPCLLFLTVLLSLVVMSDAQCAVTDHPDCIYWVPNNFCSIYTDAMIQAYCPKSCSNSGCNCPAGSTLVGTVCSRLRHTGLFISHTLYAGQTNERVRNNTCSSGTRMGAVCCDTTVTCPAVVSNGPCSYDNSCSTVGYLCHKKANHCCPVVNYTDPSNIIGPAIGGYCPIGYTMVMVPGGSSEGECVSLDTVPGICAEAVRGGPCPNGNACTAGFTCFQLAQVCCPTSY